MASTKKYICTICGFIYDEKEGDPDSGISPGTPFEQIPDDWECPDCGATRTISNPTPKKVKGFDKPFDVRRRTPTTQRAAKTCRTPENRQRLQWTLGSPT